MEQLKESEWLSINRVLLELYTLDNVKDFREKTLKVFRMLIPYSKGYFLMLNDDSTVDFEHSAFLGMEKEMFLRYLENYYDKDYLKYVFDLSYDTITYRDTDILADTMRKKTEFFREFLRPNNIPFGAGIILAKNEKIFGIINLFRGGELGDFSDKDMYIFDLLKEHLTNITWKLRIENRGRAMDKNKRLEHLAIRIGLTTKEKEIAGYIVQGMTNLQISEVMVISESTVKKHLYNIYAKAKVNNRLQFTTMIDYE